MHSPFSTHKNHIICDQCGFLLTDLGSLDILPEQNQSKQREKDTKSTEPV